MTKMCCPGLDQKYTHETYTQKNWNYASTSSQFLNKFSLFSENYTMPLFVSSVGSYQYSDIVNEGYVVMLDLFQNLNFVPECSIVNCQIDTRVLIFRNNRPCYPIH